jgi:hypothetical protein
MATPSDLARMVPGFDFFQGLLKNAGAGLPNMGQWVAPTLNPEELDKRIQELKTVQFWLEQNAKILATTIQAMEVQRMTLSTLQTMNLPLADIANALKIKPLASPAETSEAAPLFAPKPPRAAPKARARVAGKPAARSTTGGGTAQAGAGAPPAAVDPLQWWGALTQQFTELATKAVKDTAVDASKNLAGAVVRQSFDAASDVLKKAAGASGKAAARAVRTSKR